MTVEDQLQTLIHAFEYDYAGRLIREVTPKNYTSASVPTAKTDLSIYNRTEYVYDDQDRVIAEKYIYTENSITKTIYNKVYVYDQAGNVIKEMNDLGYNSVTGTHEEKVTSGYGYEYTYDYTGKQTGVLAPEDKLKGFKYTTKVVYNGRDLVSEEIDGLGNKLVKTFDAFGNVLTQTHSDRASKQTTLVTAEYDLNGHVIKNNQCRRWRCNVQVQCTGSTS